MSALSKEQLDAQKEEWISAVQSVKQRLDELAQESGKLQAQLIALQGAVEGCDVLLKKLETDTPSESAV